MGVATKRPWFVGDKVNVRGRLAVCPLVDMLRAHRLLRISREQNAPIPFARGSTPRGERNHAGLIENLLVCVKWYYRRRRYNAGPGAEHWAPREDRRQLP